MILSKAIIPWVGEKAYFIIVYSVVCTKWNLVKARMVTVHIQNRLINYINSLGPGLHSMSLAQSSVRSRGSLGSTSVQSEKLCLLPVSSILLPTNICCKAVRSLCLWVLFLLASCAN